MEFVARLGDQVSAPARAGAAGVRELRTELEQASAQLAAFTAAGGRLGAVNTNLGAAASSAQAAAGATTQAGAAFAGTSQQAAQAGASIKATWAAGQAQARAASGAFGGAGKAAISAGSAASSAAKATADIGGKAAAAGKAGGSALDKIGLGAKDGKAAVSALSGVLPLLAAGFGVAGAAGAVKMALGYRGVAQLQAITARAEVNVRKLFTGVDPSPVVRAYNRFTQIFSASTVTGKVFGDVITRSFNQLFAAVEKAEPLVTGFAQGMLLAFLYAENGVLRARLALAPYSEMLGDIFSKSALVKAAAIGGGLAIAVAGGYAAIAAAPFLTLAAAITAVVSAYEQATKLAKEWDENSSGQIWNKLADDLGVNDARKARDKAYLSGGHSDADTNAFFASQQPKAQAGASGASAAAKSGGEAGAAGAAAAKKGNDPGAAAAAGAAAGTAMAAGMVAGMAGGKAAVEAAGKDLAGAADKGVRDKAEIKSPSKLFRREGAYMGQGTVGGIRDQADAVQEAAEQALVPRPPRGGRAQGAASGGVVVNHLEVHAPHVFDEGGLAAFVRGDALGRTIEALESMGVPT